MAGDGAAVDGGVGSADSGSGPATLSDTATQHGDRALVATIVLHAIDGATIDGQVGVGHSGISRVSTVFFSNAAAGHAGQDAAMDGDIGVGHSGGGRTPSFLRTGQAAAGHGTELDIEGLAYGTLLTNDDIGAAGDIGRGMRTIGHGLAAAEDVLHPLLSMQFVGVLRHRDVGIAGNIGLASGITHGAAADDLGVNEGTAADGDVGRATNIGLIVLGIVHVDKAAADKVAVDFAAGHGQAGIARDGGAAAVDRRATGNDLAVDGAISDGHARAAHSGSGALVIGQTAAHNGSRQLAGVTCHSTGLDRIPSNIAAVDGHGRGAGHSRGGFAIERPIGFGDTAADHTGQSALVHGNGAVAVNSRSRLAVLVGLGQAAAHHGAVNDGHITIDQNRAIALHRRRSGVTLVGDGLAAADDILGFVLSTSRKFSVSDGHGRIVHTGAAVAAHIVAADDLTIGHAALDRHRRITSDDKVGVRLFLSFRAGSLGRQSNGILYHAAAHQIVIDRAAAHAQKRVTVNDGGIAAIGHHTAGHDLAVDLGITADAHAAGHILGIGTQYGARVGTIGQTATDDGGLEIDAALPVGQAAFRRIKGAAGDGHGSIAVVEDIGDACAVVVVSHAAAHHGGMEGAAAIDGDAGAIRGGCTARPSTGLDIVASHDQLVGIGFAFSTEDVAIDGHGSGAGLESSTVIIGKLAAAHHELGGSGFTADNSGDGAMRSVFVVGIRTAYIAATNDLADASALDGEGDVGGNGRIGGEFIIFVQPAAHEVIDLARSGIGTSSAQCHIRSPRGHTGAAHDQHTGHGQAAESVHQVALFEHRLVPVDQIADGSLGKLHATILHPWFYCSHVRMGRWRKSRLFRHTVRTGLEQERACRRVNSVEWNKNR